MPSGGPVVKNQPGNARDMGLITGQGTELPHATGQISPHADTRQSLCHSERLLHDATKDPMQPNK